jgi:rSAM/selenodomain-associated transferase 1
VIGPAVTGPAYIGKHRQEPRTGTVYPPEQDGEPGPGGVLAAQVIVIAKEPIPGRVKTRLTPPFTPQEAAALAEAALADTLAAVSEATVTRRVLALDGAPGRWLPPGFDVIGQRGGGLDERIAWALADARASWSAPVVLIGMDTPQVTPELLAAAAEPLVSGAADATFGMAEDGGFWLLGLRKIDPALVLGVPMSRPDTGARQLRRLVEGGLRVLPLPALTDVDTADEAERVAAMLPGSRFAARLRALGHRATQHVVAIR